MAREIIRIDCRDDSYHVEGVPNYINVWDVIKLITNNPDILLDKVIVLYLHTNRDILDNNHLFKGIIEYMDRTGAHIKVFVCRDGINQKII